MIALRFIRWCLLFIAHLVAIIAMLWAAGALSFDLPAPVWLRNTAAVLWGLGAIAGWFFIRPHWKARLITALAFALILSGWLSLMPKLNRNWKPEVALLPRVEIEGDRVTLYNIRNFEYRTETDFTPHYDTRSYNLSKLEGIDMFLCYWGSPYVAHPLMSFNFGEDGRICLSIETRPQQGQEYSAIGGLYRQFELIYIAADERDVVRVRTNYRKGEDVYLYHLNVTPEKARSRFLEYVKQINELDSKARWYNAITHNCSTSIRNQHDPSKRAAWDWRMLANGKVDAMLFERGEIEGEPPFAELKKRAHINEHAKAANDDPDFSARVRDGKAEAAK